MNIYKAEKKDLKAILELQKACYMEEAELYDDFSIPPLIQTMESLKFDFDQGIILKIEFEEEIIGSVRAHVDSDTCKIGRLIVNEKFRNKGLGKLLMNEIENQFKNVKRFELFTGHKSVRNLTLYKKLGYLEFHKQHINENLQFVFLEKYNVQNES